MAEKIIYAYENWRYLLKDMAFLVRHMNKCN